MNASQGLTAAIAQYAAAPRFGADEARALAAAQSGFVDTLATMLAGWNEPVVRIVAAHIARGPAPAEAPVLFSGTLLGSEQAACINATAAHALDYDDVSFGAHPSAVLVPALLAEGHRLGAPGRAVLQAYVVGFEAWAELFRREPDGLHRKGWHPTSTLGAVAAAAAVGSLHGLPAAQLQTALALAASQAAGLVANFGTMAKPFHAGRAAAAAIDAVRLAAAGMTASPDALEHHAGFLAALSPQGNAMREGPSGVGTGRPQLLEVGLNVKRYPVCYSGHRVIDGVVALARRHALKAADVEQVEVTIGIAQASMLRNHQPRTALEAKFSIEFAVASALRARGCGLAQLTDAFVNDAQVQALMPRVRTLHEPAPCPLDPTFALNDRVCITTRAGVRLDSGPIRFPQGHARQPLSPSELHAKFMDCLAVGGWHKQADRAYGVLGNLASLGDVRELATALARD